MNAFLATTGVTVRRDPDTGRLRMYKPGSRKDREQTAAGEYFGT
jgi:ATP-binding cassette subfamily E protein 1